MMNMLEKIVGFSNDILWSYILIALLIGLGLYFSFKLKFVQIRHLREMIRLMGEGLSGKTRKKGSVSSFQAFCISSAARIGMGNLAGVAIAIASGGPGAVFWMWLIALVGAASSFVESTLAQIYKIKSGSGFRGGPAYYMEKGLNKRWMGILFSILITISYGLVFNAVQANTITLAFNNAFHVDRSTLGIILAVLIGVIIFGGIKSIAHISELIVPVMAFMYIFVALFIVVKNIGMLPHVFGDIFANAFGFKQALGGGIGAAIKMGIKRGLFANEAGMGSAPNAAATADVTHPAKQGFIQTIGVLIDTFLVCTSTAFIVLCSGVYETSKLTGIELTQVALSSQIGSWAGSFLAIIIFLFAFSSLLGNYYYGETNIEFIHANKIWLNLYRLAVVGMILFGSVSTIQIVWNMADLFMGLMTLTNLVAIALLGKFAYAALDDYVRQKKQGKDPQFHVDNIPGLENVECWGESRNQQEKQVG
ncbi:alanine/glycine:cation symporter family protein [Microbacteriaceae bacterium 4G12]